MKENTEVDKPLNLNAHVGKDWRFGNIRYHRNLNSFRELRNLINKRKARQIIDVLLSLLHDPQSRQQSDHSKNQFKAWF